MAISLIVSDQVRFKVKGTINDATGAPTPFDFWLTCKRLKAEALQAALKDRDTEIADFMATVVTGWAGVRGQDGDEAAYTPDALAQLLSIPGVAGVAFRAYLSESGAKEKN